MVHLSVFALESEVKMIHKRRIGIGFEVNRRGQLISRHLSSRKRGANLSLNT
jgi:hypothetical protein